MSPKFVQLGCPGWIKTGGSTHIPAGNHRHAQSNMAGVFQKSRDIKRHLQTVAQRRDTLLIKLQIRSSRSHLFPFEVRG